ncbi:MAG: glycoside hydrolase family 16 protein [Firmicutes bacterium]|nr:glycoside hydrolase family 16 protein [Bacillota bacterium]
MKKYILDWSDEFDVDGLPDPTKWSFDTGSKKWGNGEPQYYTDGKNSTIKNSILNIEGRVEPFEDSPYTSARLTTYQKKHFMYGRIEVKAKVPTAKGSWPAIWLLPIDFKEKKSSWPRCGEIDIMEHVSHLFDNIHVSLHTELFNHVQRTQRTHFEYLEGITSDFQVYAMDWTKDYIEFFINEKLFAHYDKIEEGYDTSELGWPFDKPYYLILNQAIGGTWGGDVNVKDYPSPFLIDYVRYYKIIEE